MSDNEIVVEITGKDSTGAAFKSASKNAEEMGQKSSKASEAAKLGFWTMGEAAENAAQSLGVPNQAARQLGNAVESLASKMGGMAVPIGIAVLAIGAAVAVWKKLKEEKERVNQETIKAGKGFLDEAIGMDKNWVASEKLKDSTYGLYVAKRNMAILTGPATIRAMKEELEELTKQIDKTNELTDTKLRYFMGEERATAYDEKRAKLLGEIGVKLETIRIEEERLAQLINDKAGRKDVIGSLTIHEQTAFALKAIYGKMYQDLEDMNLQHGLNILVQYREQKQVELALEQTHTDAMLNTMGNALTAYAAATGKNAKVIFLAQKALALGQIWVDTGRAAMSAAATAAALGPGAAAAAAASMWKLGYINMAIVAATTLAGLSSAGKAGAAPPTGTYPASPITGQPTGGSGGSNYTFVIGGQRYTAEDLAREIDRNNGNIGNLQLSYQRI